MRTYTVHPAVLLASTLVGFILGVLLLLLMLGGGYILALIVLAMLPVAFMVLAIESILAGLAERRRVEAALAPAPPTPEVLTEEKGLTVYPMWRAVAFSLVGAVALAAFHMGIWTMVSGFAHAQDEIKRNFFLYIPILAGFGVLMGFFVTAREKGAPVWMSAVLAAIGTAVGTFSLINCCIWPLALKLGVSIMSTPILSTIFLATRINEGTVALAGIAINILGLIILARSATRPLMVRA